MPLARQLDLLTALGDESRLRLCALLEQRELCVTDLVKITGISQSRVSTHLARLREAGLVVDRRQGTQSFYALAHHALPRAARSVLEEVVTAADPLLEGDRERLAELEAERRSGLSDVAADEIERYYSPGRTWQSLALGLASLLELGDVLDVGSGDGAAAASFAGACRSLTCIDTNPKLAEAARERLSGWPHVCTRVADVQALPFAAGTFDVVVLFHTLTYAEQPARALEQCARVLRRGGKLVLLCLDQHRQLATTSRYGERHPGFSPGEVRRLLTRAGLRVSSSEVVSREVKKPHLQVVRALAVKPATAAAARTPRKRS